MRLWIRRLIRRWRERHVDAAWAPTGYRYSFRGYDSSKPSLAARRAHECEVEQRALAQARAGTRTTDVLTSRERR